MVYDTNGAEHLENEQPVSESDAKAASITASFSKPSEYHNAAIDMHRIGDVETAIEILRIGLEEFVADLDLLAYAVSWAPLCPRDAERLEGFLYYAEDFYDFLMELKGSGKNSPGELTTSALIISSTVNLNANRRKKRKRHWKRPFV